MTIRDGTQNIELDNEEYLKDVMNRYGSQLKKYAYIMVKDEHLV